MVIGGSQKVDLERTIDGNQGATILAFFMMWYHKRGSAVFPALIKIKNIGASGKPPPLFTHRIDEEKQMGSDYASTNAAAVLDTPVLVVSGGQFVAGKPMPESIKPISGMAWICRDRGNSALFIADGSTHSKPPSSIDGAI
jgi:hypothetical protein